MGKKPEPYQGHRPRQNAVAIQILRQAAGWHSPVATPGNPPAIVPMNPVPPTLMTCKNARQLVRNNGYKKVRKVECNGAVYTFTAKKEKKGPKVVVKVHALTGTVSEV
jgi:hypothetical protein